LSVPHGIIGAQERKNNMAKTQTEWLKYLGLILPEGQRVYGLIRKRAKSGMTKYVSLYTITETYSGQHVLCDFTLQATAALHMHRHVVGDAPVIAVRGAGFCPVLHMVELLEKFLERELTYEVM
jgi:hypothetical protein